MKLLQPHERELVGTWVVANDQVHGDEACERIKWLVTNALEEIGFSKQYGAWETLYRDRLDSRYWVKTYPQSEMHGGGPPALKCISEGEAKANFECRVVT